MRQARLVISSQRCCAQSPLRLLKGESEAPKSTELTPEGKGQEDGRKTGQVRKTSPEIRGNTLKVYLFMLKHGPSELREVQRGLGLSTPSLASYHLEKLIDAGFASQNERGQYSAVTEASGEILEGFSRVGFMLVPQLLFFAVLFTPLVGYFTLMSLHSTAYVPLLAATSVCLVAVVWYQTALVWRRLSGAR